MREPLAIPGLIRKAKVIAREKGITMAVVEMDEGESRRCCIVRDEYTHSAEFEAFDGYLIAEVYPSGETYP